MWLLSTNLHSRCRWRCFAKSIFVFHKKPTTQTAFQTTCSSVCVWFLNWSQKLACTRGGSKNIISLLTQNMGQLVVCKFDYEICTKIRNGISILCVSARNVLCQNFPIMTQCRLQKRFLKFVSETQKTVVNLS